MRVEGEKMLVWMGPGQGGRWKWAAAVGPAGRNWGVLGVEPSQKPRGPTLQPAGAWCTGQMLPDTYRTVPS